MILLSYDQRMAITGDGRLITYGDIHWQGKYQEALPAGYLDAGRKKIAIGWTNAENQWYDAPMLSRYIGFCLRSKENDGRDLRHVEQMLVDLIALAALAK